MVGISILNTMEMIAEKLKVTKSKESEVNKVEFEKLFTMEEFKEFKSSKSLKEYKEVLENNYKIEHKEGNNLFNTPIPSFIATFFGLYFLFFGFFFDSNILISISIVIFFSYLVLATCFSFYHQYILYNNNLNFKVDIEKLRHQNKILDFFYDYLADNTSHTLEDLNAVLDFFDKVQDFESVTVFGTSEDLEPQNLYYDFTAPNVFFEESNTGDYFTFAYNLSDGYGSEIEKLSIFKLNKDTLELDI